MRRFFVQIKDDSFRTLQDQAIRERRDVRSQAALVLEQALRVPGESGVTPEPSREQREPVPA